MAGNIETRALFDVSKFERLRRLKMFTLDFVAHRICVRVPNLFGQFPCAKWYDEHRGKKGKEKVKNLEKRCFL